MSKVTVAEAIDCNDPTLTTAQDLKGEWLDGFTYQDLESQIRSYGSRWWTTSICTTWMDQDEITGDLTDAYCPSSEINYYGDGNIFEALCLGNTECVGVLRDGDSCVYDSPVCSNGYFWYLTGTPYTSEGYCEECPQFNYAPGKYASVSSTEERNNNDYQAASGQNLRFCYVPAGNTFTDNAGTFQYVQNCFFYGS